MGHSSGNSSDSERVLDEMLQAFGHHPVPQKAIGPYNVDLAVGSVAVEVLGGEWHGYKPRHRERTEQILDAGWSMVFVWDTPTYPLAVGVHRESGAADVNRLATVLGYSRVAHMGA